MLDNAHQFAERLTAIPSRDNGFHTVLSWLLTILASWKCPCIVSGTTDKDLHKMNDFSNFFVHHIYLTAIPRKHWNDIGREMIAKFNAQAGTNVVWEGLDVTEARDFGSDDEMPICDDEDSRIAGSAADVPMLKHTFAPGDNAALLGMIYQSAQIPRFMRLAFTAWHMGKSKGLSLMAIIEVVLQLYLLSQSHYFHRTLKLQLRHTILTLARRSSSTSHRFLRSFS